MILALLLAAPAALPPHPGPPGRPAAEEAAFEAALGKLDLPNTALTLAVTTTKAGIPITTEHQAWWRKKRGHIRQPGKAPTDIYLDLAAKTLVALDVEKKQAVRFRFAGRPGEDMVRQALGGMGVFQGLVKTGATETVAGKTCDIYEGEVSQLVLGVTLKSKERHCMWKGLALRSRIERPAQEVKTISAVMSLPETVVVTEVKELKLGGARPADLELPRGTKVQAMEDMLVPPPPREAPEPLAPPKLPVPKLPVPGKK